MTDAALPFRHAFPLVNTDDILVMVFRHHHVTGARPVIYVKALVAAEFHIDSHTDRDVLGSPAITGPTETLSAGEIKKITLPTGVFDPLNQVSALRIVKGKLSVDLRSHGEVQVYFSQPFSLGGTTGRPGGWPTSPDPVFPPAP